MKSIFTFLTVLLLSTGALAQLVCDNTIICDDFENYVVGALGPQAEHWTTWSGMEGGTEDGIVSEDFAASGSKSFKIEGQSGPQDVLLLLGNRTSGNYRLEFKYYVWEGQRAYFNLQKDETPAVQWGQAVYFEEDGTGYLEAGGADAATFTFPHDEWFTITQFIDLDNDWTSLFIDDKPVYSWQFSLSSLGSSTPILQLGAIDFYATSAGNHLFWVDDVRLQELPPNDGAKRMVQFNVDASLEDVSPEGIFLAGTFNDWNATATPMEHIGDNIWQGYYGLDEATDHLYKFINGDDWESVPEDCGQDDGFGGYNRSLFVGLEDEALQTVCMNHCVVCSEVSGTKDQLLNANLGVSPNPASAQTRISYELDAPAALQLELINALGQPVYRRQLQSAASGTVTIDLTDLAPGVYFVTLRNGEKRVSERLMVR